MSDVPFYQTGMGRKYYEATMPELVRQLTRLNDMLAVHSELLEKLIAAKSTKEIPRQR